MEMPSDGLHEKQNTEVVMSEDRHLGTDILIIIIIIIIIIITIIIIIIIYTYIDLFILLLGFIQPRPVHPLPNAKDVIFCLIFFHD